MDHRCNDWKHFACVLCIAKSQISEKRHRGQNLQCKLANEDDLQSKSIVKEIVLRIVLFYKRND